MTTAPVQHLESWYYNTTLTNVLQNSNIVRLRGGRIIFVVGIGKCLLIQIHHPWTDYLIKWISIDSFYSSQATAAVFFGLTNRFWLFNCLKQTLAESNPTWNIAAAVLEAYMLVSLSYPEFRSHWWVLPKWFMHNGHNNGQKIQKSAIFSTYLPNLEALCHGIACVCTNSSVGRSGSCGSTTIVK